MFRSFMRQSSGHPLNNSSIKSKTYAMLAHYQIPCGFTKLVKYKNKQNQFLISSFRRVLYVVCNLLGCSQAYGV
jgi:hypothetical protein